MKKQLFNKFLGKKRERKRLRRKRKGKKFDSSVLRRGQGLRIKYERRIVENHKSYLFEFLIEKKFIVGTEDASINIKIGKHFSIDENYDETIKKISDIVYSMWINAGSTIEIDFSDCQKVDQGALFLLQILRLEFQEEFEKLNRRLVVLDSRLNVQFTESKDSDVNLHLFLCGLISTVVLGDSIQPINTLGYLKGSRQQRSYLENKKGLNASKIVNYINTCLTHSGFELNNQGRNDLTNLIGEVLNNAEDHSPFMTYYVTANYHHEVCNSNLEIVGELNLSFLNFGYSIYEGLEDNKSENAGVYKVLTDGCEIILKKDSTFSKENLFTLFALQEGISRLKFENESRGTGTMKFIRCFFSMGDYEDRQRKKIPNMSILSGKTRLVCDKAHEPFIKENRYFMSLNDEKDLTLPPDKSHLKKLDYAFPGTLLTLKVFLNSDHIKNKFGNRGNN